jgi:hypothetical protein
MEAAALAEVYGVIRRVVRRIGTDGQDGGAANG